MRTHQALAALAAMAIVTGAAAAPAVGDIPPAYVGKTADDTPVMLDGLKGKVVVLSYWATWCPHCLKELPVLENIQRAVGPEHLQVIAVDTEPWRVFRRVERQLKPTVHLQLAYDPGDKGQQAYGVNAIPLMVIVGRDGRIAAIHRGYGEDAIDGIVADINRATGATSK